MRVQQHRAPRLPRDAEGWRIEVELALGRMVGRKHLVPRHTTRRLGLSGALDPPCVGSYTSRLGTAHSVGSRDEDLTYTLDAMGARGTKVTNVGGRTVPVIVALVAGSVWLASCGSSGGGGPNVVRAPANTDVGKATVGSTQPSPSVAAMASASPAESRDIDVFLSYEPMPDGKSGALSLSAPSLRLHERVGLVGEGQVCRAQVVHQGPPHGVALRGSCDAREVDALYAMTREGRLMVFPSDCRPSCPEVDVGEDGVNLLAEVRGQPPLAVCPSGPERWVDGFVERAAKRDDHGHEARVLRVRIPALGFVADLEQLGTPLRVHTRIARPRRLEVRVLGYESVTAHTVSLEQGVLRIDSRSSDADGPRTRIRGGLVVGCDARLRWKTLEYRDPGWKWIGSACEAGCGDVYERCDTGCYAKHAGDDGSLPEAGEECAMRCDEAAQACRARCSAAGK